MGDGGGDERGSIPFLRIPADVRARGACEADVSTWTSGMTVRQC